MLSPNQASLGVAYTGRPGAGKSTALRQLLKHFAELGCIICWCCIKPDEADIAASVLPDAVRFRPGSHVFNPITYELNREGGSASNLASFHDDLNDVLNRSDSQKQEAFWKSGATDTLVYAIELARLVKDEPTYADAYNIITSSPQNLEVAVSEDFRSTACGWFINMLGNRNPNLAKPFADFFMQRLPASGEKARGAFVTQSVSSFKHFVDGPMSKVVEGVSTITPEQMLTHHTILDFDTLTHGIGGLAFQLMMSWLCMEAVLRRKGEFPYFVLVRDEYHQLAHAERDIRTQAVGRSQKFIGVSAFQSIPVLEAAMSGGVEAQTQARALYGLHVNKFMMNSNCPTTNEANSMVIGQEKQMFFGGSPNPQQDLEWYDVLGVGAGPQVSFSQQWHYRVPPTAFTSLRSGGPENDWTVDAIFHDGNDYQQVSFYQR